MATRDDVYTALRNADAAGDAASVQKLAAYLKTLPADAAPVVTPSPATTARIANDEITKDAQSGPSILGEFGRQVGNLVAGGVRGAGSIGATIMYPADKLGLTGMSNDQRRQDMDAALRNLGADTSAPAFKVGKIGAEIAGTAGTGGVIANTAGRAAPIVAEAAPNLINAIRTGGMVAAPAGEVSPAVNLLTRAAGGAINGGASAGLVDPSQAGSGSLIGGSVPIVAKVAGTTGNLVGNLVRGPSQIPEAAAAIEAARKAGYVIPPAQANPTLINRVLEGVAGKVSTAQAASARNAAVTNGLAADAVGLPAGTTITPEALDAIRKDAGKAYANVAGMGTLDATGAKLPASANVQRGYDNMTLAPNATVDARDVVNAWKQANADAKAYRTAYSRDAQPETLAKAQAAEADAKSLDTFLARSVTQREGQSVDDLTSALARGRLGLEDFIKQALNSQLVQSGSKQPGKEALDAARTQIAKTYSVESALNPETGTVSALNLAKQAAKGKPLSGGLDTAASFAARFPKAAQTPESMGSLPGTSPLDWWAALLSPQNLASVATLGVRPAARYLALSPAVQGRLARSGAAPSGNLIGADQLAALGYRAAPSALSDR